jgi:hypothetical protein
MHIIKKVSLFMASFALLGAVLMPGAALAADTNASDVCQGLALTGGQCGPDDPTKPGINSTIKLVINLLSLVVGVISVIMIIIGGLKYITSQGESSNVNGAKNTILYAIVGLVIVALAQIIVKFVLNKVDPTALPKCTTTITTNCTR